MRPPPLDVVADSYVMCNERNYRCSSQTNGRDSICTQRRVVNRTKTEERLIAGVKEKLLAPTTLKEITARVQRRVRERKQPDRSIKQAELARVDRELANVIDALAKVGISAALVSRVRELEAQNVALTRELAAAFVPEIVPNIGQVTAVNRSSGRSRRYPPRKER